MQHDGLSTSMGGLWRNLDAMATTDPAGGFRTAEYTRSALIRRINLVGYRKRYFVMQLGLRLLCLLSSLDAPLPSPRRTCDLPRSPYAIKLCRALALVAIAVVQRLDHCSHTLDHTVCELSPAATGSARASHCVVRSLAPSTAAALDPGNQMRHEAKSAGRSAPPSDAAASHRCNAALRL